MIISDGTTDLTFTYASDQTPDPELDRATATSSGGRLKTQISGERFIMTESVAVTGAELRSLFNLLTNGADSYYYTPSSTPPEYDSADFPMEVTVEYRGKTERVYNGAKIYYVDLVISGVEYQ